MIEVVLQTESCHWIDIIDQTEEDAQEISRIFKLHPLALQDALDPKHLPKIEKFEEIFFLVLRHFDEECHYTGTNVRELTRKISIFMGKDFLITMHRKENSITHRIKSMVLSGLGSPQEIVMELIDSVIKTYEDAVENEQDAIDIIEEKIFKNRGNTEILEDLYGIKQKAYVYKRMLAQHKEILISREIKSIIHNPADLQDSVEMASHMLYNADELQEATSHLLAVHLSIASFKTGEVMRLLTIFSLFFMPLTFLAGIYGMNFEHMPELAWPLGYPIALGFMAFMSLGLYIWFRQSGWLK